MTLQPEVPRDAIDEAAALLQGIADEARFDRMRGIELWCDDDLATSLRELFRTVALAQRKTKTQSSRSVEAKASSNSGKTAAERSGYQKVLDAIEGGAADTTPQPTPVPKPAPTPVAGAKKSQWGPPPIASGRDSGWADQLAAVAAEARECRACGLCETRRNVVFGVGSGHVPVVFIGEAPGADEDREGFPFVGKSGQLLTRIIEAIGLDRDEVYIANVLKCRPPANRNPTAEEITRCTPFLTRQLEILRPKVICTLGLFASQFLLDTTQSMGRMRGQRFTYERIPVIPTYHPSALLRNPDLKAKTWADVQLLRKILDDAP